MLEVNGRCIFIDVGKTPGPAQAELLLFGFFLPLRKLLDIVDRFAPEIGREIVYHAMDGFSGRHDESEFCCFLSIESFRLQQ
jgi:hypothetical protein